jgi:transposase-like protein
MSEKIVQLNEEVIKGQIKELVRGSVEETLNELLEAEAEKLTHAARYERNEQRQGYRSGHYSRNLTTTSGDVTLKVAKMLKAIHAQESKKAAGRRQKQLWKSCAL